MAHILPEQPRTWRDYPMASPPVTCIHGVPYVQQCHACGWVCPTCKRAYAPWVRECNYSHGEDQPRGRRDVPPDTFTPILPAAACVADLRLPPEMVNPDYQRIVRVGRDWQEILPDLECYVRNPIPEEDGSVTICLRLAPQDAT